VTFLEFLRLLRGSLFKAQDILIYVRELDKGIAMKGGEDVGAYISREAPAFMEKVRKKGGALAWEFSCDIYDGVKDCFVYKKKGVIGHISWVYYREDPNRLINLSDDEAEIKYCLTLPEFRGRGIYPAVLKKIQSYLKDGGIRRAFICVERGNTPSIRGIEKAGFRPVASTRLIKVCGIQVNRKFSSNKEQAKG